MKGFYLADDELRRLREAHREAKRSNALVAYKINAVILLGTGWKLKQVKEALLLDDETLRSYVAKYRKEGVKALICTHYPGRPSQLNEKQLEQLRKELESRIHLMTGSVIDYVQTRFGIVYTLQLHKLTLLNEKYTPNKE